MTDSPPGSPAATQQALEIGTRRTFRGDGSSAAESSVPCPARGHEVPIEGCLDCDRFRGLRVRAASGEAVVVCHTDASSEAMQAAERRLGGGSGAASATPVSEIMTRDVVCVSEGLGVDALVELFIQRGISGAPVVDKAGRPVGIVSKTDVLRDGAERAGGLPRNATVGDIMMPVAFCLPANESVARAAALMAFEGVHRLPIVGVAGEVVGLVSPLDVLRWLAREQGYVMSGRSKSDRP
jgi:CBS domain-containing protein